MFTESLLLTCKTQFCWYMCSFLSNMPIRKVLYTYFYLWNRQLHTKLYIQVWGCIWVKNRNLALARHSVQSQGLQSKVMQVVDDIVPIYGTICLMTSDKKLTSSIIPVCAIVLEALQAILPSSVIPVYSIMLEVLQDVFSRFVGHNISYL